MQLSKNISLAVLGRSLTAVSGFALAFFLPLCLGLAETGFVYLVITQATLFSVVARSGLDYSVNERLIAKAEDDSETRISFWLGMLRGCIFVAVVGFLLILVGGATPEWVRAFGCVSLLGTSFAFSAYLFQLNKIDGRVVRASLMRGFSHNVALLAGCCALLFLYDSQPSSLGFCCVFGFVLVVTLGNAWVCLAPHFRKSKFSLSSFSLARAPLAPKFMAYSLLSYGITDVDYMFLAYFQGNEELAVYSTMKRLALMAAILIDVGNLIFPKIYKDGMESAAGMRKAGLASRRLALVFSLCALVAFIVTLFFAESLIALAGGEGYVSGYPVILVLMAAFVLMLATGFAEVFLLLKGDRDALLKNMVWSLIVVIICNLFLVPLMGAPGAALSFLISNVLMKLALTIHVQRKYNLKLYIGWR